MNIFNKVALQGLKKNRTRTLVTIAGVVLSTVLITAVATFAVSVQNYMVNGAIVKYGGWHVEIPDANLSFVEEMQKDSRVENVAALQNIGYATLENSKNADKPYLFISGWEEKDFDTLPVKLISGRLPQNNREVLVPSHLAANGGVKISVGDVITLAVGERMDGSRKLSQHDSYSGKAETLGKTAPKTYTVVGICQRPAIEEYSAPGYTLITRADTEKSDSNSVLVTLKNPYRLHSYTKDIKGRYSYILNDEVLRFLGLSGQTMIIAMFYSIVVILVMLVVVGSVFLIYNAFNISLNERTHQFGIMMSVGATAKQLRNSVLFEGLCIGIIGIPIGIFAGIGGIKVVLSLVEKSFKNIMYDAVPLDMVISAPYILAAIVVSIVTILISAYIPAKKAASVPVMECIRQTNEIKGDGKKLKTPRFVQRIFGLEGTLAFKNFKRNKRRYRSIVLSLTFSVVLFVLSSTFCDNLNQVAENSGEVVEQYDIVFSTRDMEEKEVLRLYDELKGVAGVTESGYQAEITYPCTINKSELSGHFFDTFGEFLDDNKNSETIDVMVDAVFIDDAAYQKFLKGCNLPADDYTGQDGKMLVSGYIEGSMYMQDAPMEMTFYDKNGDEAKTIQVTYVNDYPDLLPAEAGDDFRGYAFKLIAPYEMKKQFEKLGTATVSTLGMTFESDNPGGSTSQMRTIIDANGIADNYTLYNVYGILEQNRNLTFIINLFAAVFIVMITLISVANVFNTISTNIKLRKKEFAMLRSVGMSDRDFNKMMRFECVLYGARTIMWGVPLSAVLSYLLYKMMVRGGYELGYNFPWLSISVSVLGVFLIVFITMLYATGKIRKENIIDSLRDDMT